MLSANVNYYKIPIDCSNKKYARSLVGQPNPATRVQLEPISKYTKIQFFVLIDHPFTRVAYARWPSLYPIKSMNLGLTT